MQFFDSTIHLRMLTFIPFIMVLLLSSCEMFSAKEQYIGASEKLYLKTDESIEVLHKAFVDKEGCTKGDGIAHIEKAHDIWLSTINVDDYAFGVHPDAVVEVRKAADYCYIDVPTDGKHHVFLHKVIQQMIHNAEENKISNPEKIIEDASFILYEAQRSISQTEMTLISANLYSSTTNQIFGFAKMNQVSTISEELEQAIDDMNQMKEIAEEKMENWIETRD